MNALYHTFLKMCIIFMGISIFFYKNIILIILITFNSETEAMFLKYIGKTLAKDFYLS